jgi:PAS domain S-box-containing protein
LGKWAGSELFQLASAGFQGHASRAVENALSGYYYRMRFTKENVGIQAGSPQRRLFSLIFPLLGVVLVIGAAAVIWYLANQIGQRDLDTAVDDAKTFSRSVTQFRNFYSAEIVPRARESGMKITHAYQHVPNALPLPATFTLDFGDFLSSQSEGFGVQLYSKWPFPWRAENIQLDDFQRAAIASLTAKPDEPFFQVVPMNGVPTLRYAVADRMLESCVACHNSYPGSPKMDWQLGDVRGVLEVRRSMQLAEESLAGGLRNAAYLSALMIATVLLLLWASLQSLLRTMREKEASNLQLREEIEGRNQARSALRLNEAKQRAIFDSILDAIVVIDTQGRIVQTNRVAEEMFAYAADEMLGQNISMLMPSPHAEQHDGYLARYLRTGEASIIGNLRVLTARRKCGEIFSIQLAVSHVETGGDSFFAGVIVDITERLAQEADLRLARDEALESLRIKSEFLANMSHEIRTPMNGVIGMNDLLLDTPLSEEQRALALTVQKSSESLLKIINDILDLSKIEAGKLHFENVIFDPLETIEEVLELFSERAADKGLEIGYRTGSPLPRQVIGDEGRLRQVLSNLVGNAIKFTEAGEVEILVSADPEQPCRLEIAVCDTGIGIPEDKQSLLFQSFSQVDGSITRRFGGTGLGLAISRQLVHLMGGEIDMHSQAGAGATFHFSVNLTEPPTGLDFVARLPAGLPVLYVGLRRLLPVQLQSWGLDVCRADGRGEIVEILRGSPERLVLLDLSNASAPVHDVGALRDACQEAGVPLPKLVLLLTRRQRIDDSPELVALPRLYLPVRQAALASQLITVAALKQAVVTTPAGKLSDDLRGLRVLVVEDNVVNQTLVRALLGKLGIASELAENGELALARMSDSPWDLVLMDCQMPVMDGFTATRRWREIEQAQGAGQRLPIIALTANAMEGDREHCLAAGMDDYLSKPLKLDVLQEKLLTWSPVSLGKKTR